MYRVPDETLRRFVETMDGARIAVRERGYYQKWLRYYLDYCAKYRMPAGEAGSLAPFIEKLASKNQSDAQRQQAARAVLLYLRMQGGTQQESTPTDTSPLESPPPARAGGCSSAAACVSGQKSVAARSNPSSPVPPTNRKPLAVLDGAPPDAAPNAKPSRGPTARRPDAQATGIRAAVAGTRSASSPVTGASWAKELDALKNTIRLRNYSPRTSETYHHWTRKFQAHTRSKPPDELSTEDVKAFLTDLAVR